MKIISLILGVLLNTTNNNEFEDFCSLTMSETINMHFLFRFIEQKLNH